MLTIFLTHFMDSVSSIVWPTEAKDWGVLVQSLFTIAVIIVGSYWGYLQFGWFRVTKPHAIISNQISHRSLNQGHIHVAIEVCITNSSKVVLNIRVGSVNIYHISTSDLKELGIRIGEATDKEGPQWPPLGNKKLDFPPQGFVIEPGETDTRIYEFIIADEVSSVLVDSYFYNDKVVKYEPGLSPRQMQRRKDWFRREVTGPRVWRTTSVYDIK